MRTILDAAECFEENLNMGLATAAICMLGDSRADRGSKKRFTYQEIGRLKTFRCNQASGFLCDITKINGFSQNKDLLTLKVPNMVLCNQ
jgi:hypothetical protein